MFGGRVFQQAVGIPMGTNCSSSRRFFPLFLRGALHTGTSQKNECPFKHINNYKFDDFVDQCDY